MDLYKFKMKLTNNIILQKLFNDFLEIEDEKHCKPLDLLNNNLLIKKLGGCLVDERNKIEQFYLDQIFNIIYTAGQNNKTVFKLQEIDTNCFLYVAGDYEKIKEEFKNYLNLQAFK